jgi:hypothetical protein
MKKKIIPTREEILAKFAGMIVTKEEHAEILRAAQAAKELPVGTTYLTRALTTKFGQTVVIEGRVE